MLGRNMRWKSKGGKSVNVSPEHTTMFLMIGATQGDLNKCAETNILAVGLDKRSEGTVIQLGEEHLTIHVPHDWSNTKRHEQRG